MPEISTYVFFDIETTGLPWQERNQTKIIEASFIAVLRKDIEDTPFGTVPPLSKLTFLLNPQRQINPEVSQLTGLSNTMLRNSPTFKSKFRSLLYFLEDLPKPLCLIAHNGNSFDYKILLAECQDSQLHLPIDLLCVDSLVGFRKILKGTSISYKDLKPETPDIVLTDDDDDEEDWPELNLSHEDWGDIDEICSSLSDISCSNVSDDDEFINNKRDLVIEQVFSKNKKTKQNNVDKENKKKEQNNAVKERFTLSDLYQRLLNKEVVNAHRAEGDCMMLIECVVALKQEFLTWADEASKFLTDIKPLKRY